MQQYKKLYPLRSTFEERFWRWVEKTENCWNWKGSLDRNGRGHLRIGRANEGQIGASVASYKIHFGNVPDGLYVLHHCDNSKCVRPDHLYAGTQKQNMEDKSRRGRHHLQGHGELVRGERNANSRLVKSQVEEIRTLHSSGSTGADLARKFGVTKENIYSIVKKKTWI